MLKIIFIKYHISSYSYLCIMTSNFLSEKDISVKDKIIFIDSCFLFFNVYKIKATFFY